MISTDLWKIESRGNYEVIVLTEKVRDFVRSSGCKEGFVNLFYKHTTGSIIIGEYEVGILVDLKNALENIIKTDHPFLHHLRGVDKNGQAHIWSILLSPSAQVFIPVSNGDLVLGKFQDLIMFDMQTETNPREIFVQLIGVE